MNLKLDPTNDNLFKLLFQNEEVAASFIESIIHQPVHDFALMPVEVKTNNQKAKRIIFDYACLVNENIMITVEMQKSYLSKKELVDRMGYYHFRSGAQLLAQGEAYEKQCKLYTIVLCTKAPFRKRKHKRELNLQDYEHYLKFTKSHLIFYDLDAAYDQCFGKKVETLTPQQVWFLYLMHVFKKMPEDYLNELMKRKELEAVNTQISKTGREMLEAVVKALDGMPDDDVRHFERIEKTNEKLLKEHDELNKIMLEKDQKIYALEQMIKKLQSPMLQS